jgi:hypothetical protein
LRKYRDLLIAHRFREEPPFLDFKSMKLYAIFLQVSRQEGNISTNDDYGGAMKRLLLVGLLLSVFSAQVIAAENSDDVFNRVDIGKDAQITLDEFLQSDIAVSKGEKDVYTMDLTGSGAKDGDAATSEKHKRALFERLDVDKNGAVNRREWMDSLSTGLVIFRY